MTKDDIYYRALLARDYRFDGKFFVAVKTTHIYCRPICPARPKRENVEFFPTALAAEKAGYRPCLRCRPECAPGTPAWSGKSAAVQRALRLLGDGLDEDTLAGKVGMSARHLRRLFEDELGQTPKQIHDGNRLAFARTLVVDTPLPISEIAFASGFQSLRRFNDAFVKRFKRSPSVLRGNKSVTASDGFLDLSLSFRPPFDWESIYENHRRHATLGVERFTDGVYERLFRFEESLGVCRVSFPDPATPKLRVSILASNPRALLPVTRRVRAMFDLDSDPLLIANHFASTPFLAALWKKYPGLRVPRGWDPFETAIATVLGQLVSTRQACRLVEQLVVHYGEKVTHPVTGETTFLFPPAKTLASSDLLHVKTTKARRESIRRLAARGIEREGLLDVPGIGPWSEQYIALRALGDTDAFPKTDLVLKRALRDNPDLDLDSVRPWRSYLAVHLWKEYAK